MSKTIITSAICYTNNIVHAGNIIGSVLSADVFSRYLKKSKPKDSIIFVGGTDDYGSATEVKAKELGITFKELCDKNVIIHKQIYDWFLIEFDCFSPTSQPNGEPLSHPQLDWPQTSITHEIFKNLVEKNYIVEKDEHVLYCRELDKIIADRFVMATCPACHKTCASDQCDCGKLLSASEIINPQYKPNPSFKLELRTSKNLFIDLNKVWEDYKMTDWFHSKEKSWTKNASDITNDWLKKGMHARSITRELNWGTSIPYTDNFKDTYKEKSIYCWIDAPFGYISSTEVTLGKQMSENYWKDPETKLIQFMAKDNVPFHSIIFPVTLRGSGYSQITNIDIVSTEYLLYEGGKFSKSNNIGLFGDDIIKISEQYNLSPDYWRAYLVYIRPENSDSNFVLNGQGGFVDFVNNILVNNLGNMLHRILSLSFQIHNKHAIDNIEIDDTNCDHNNLTTLQTDLESLSKEYESNMNAYKLCDGLKIALRYSTRLNVCINETEPWNLIKNNEKKRQLYVLMTHLYKHVITLSDLFEPFTPNLSKRIKKDFILEKNTEKSTITIALSTTKPNIMINPLNHIIYEPSRNER